MPNEDPGARFARRLRQYRDAAGMTQEDLGVAIARIEGRSKPYSQGAVAAWETAEKYPRTPSFVFMIEQALNIKPGTLSAIVGYVPPRAAPPTTVPDAIAADKGLTREQREALTEMWEGMRKRTAEKTRKRRPPADR
mgnify:CR=1 FL=1